jgi:hypothetical protein
MTPTTKQVALALLRWYDAADIATRHLSPSSTAQRALIERAAHAAALRFITQEPDGTDQRQRWARAIGKMPETPNPIPSAEHHVDGAYTAQQSEGFSEGTRGEEVFKGVET